MNAFLSDCYQRFTGGFLLPFYETRLRGRNSFRYRDEFEANQWRTPEEIAGLQWERLRALLRHAYETVPYYRQVFAEHDLRPEQITTPSDFARLPILEKETIRRHKERLVSSRFDPAKLIRSATGGSTGEPMQFYYDHNSYERRMAAAMRGDSWAGWKLCGGEFYLWGMPLIPESRWKRWKVRGHHGMMRRAIINSYDLSPERMEEGARICNRLKPRVFVGYANALYEFARYVQKAGLNLPPPQGIIMTAEKSYEYQRALVEEVFRAPVFDRYGCREVMMIGAECERHHGLHVTADNVYVEIVRNGQICEPGERGEILLTDLHNYGMPLLRYKVGDIGSWKGQDCPCGRGLPLMNIVEGRLLDVICTASGRVIAGEFFPRLFRDMCGVRTYQVVQEQRDLLTVRVALEAPLSSEDGRFLKETVENMFGAEMRVHWEIGPHVAIEQGRKFRPVLSLRKAFIAV